MSRERPIELFWRYWTVPKGGSTDEQNEDACSVRRLDLGDSAPGLLVAVSDGATEAVYSRAWARALVAAVEPDWPTLSDAYLDERLARVGRAFSPIEPGQQVPWYVRNKLLSQGSQATLLAAVLAGSDGSDSFVVSAVAIGDSCLLIFRTDGDVAAFPIQLARDFGLNPDLVRNRFATPVRADRWQGKLAPGDVLLACTDAVGRWILQCLESGQADLALRAVLDLLTLAHEDSLSQGEQLTGLQLERALAETLEPRAGEAACAPSSGEPPSVEPPDASPAENHLASDPLPATPSSREGVPPGAVVRRGSIVPDGLRRLAERIGLCPGLPRSADDEPSSAALDAERPDPHSDSTPAADPPSQLEAEGRGIGTTSLEKGPQPGSLPENDGTRSTLSRLPGSQAAEPAPIVPAAVPMPDSGASSPVSSGTAGQSAFADLVRRQRDPDSPVRMRNDDSTLVVCIPVRGAGDQGFREALTVIRKHVATARAQRPVARAGNRLIRETSGVRPMWRPLAGTRYYRRCGAAVGATVEPICPACGFAIPPGTRFCRRCGTPTDETAVTPVQRGDARRTRWIAGGVGIAVVLSLLVLVYALPRERSVVPITATALSATVTPLPETATSVPTTPSPPASPSAVPATPGRGEGSVEAAAARIKGSVAQVVVAKEGGTGIGSGLVLTSDGSVLTNHHVIDGATSVEVWMAGRRLPATVVRSDATLDLALLRASGSGLVPIAWTDSDRLVLGQTVLVVGFPVALGGEPTVSLGIVSTFRASSEGIRMVQTDAAVNPGNSGGPLVDLSGAVAGVISSRWETAGDRAVQGIGFAIPSNDARRWVEQAGGP